MDDEGVTAVETEQLVLPSSLDCLDSPAPGGTCARGRKFAAESGVDRPYRGYRFAERGTGQSACGALDLR